MKPPPALGAPGHPARLATTATTAATADASDASLTAIPAAATATGAAPATGASATAPVAPDTLTALYDGQCPLCRREIAHVQGLAQRQGDNALCFVDVSAAAAGDAALAADRAALLARFHVQRADGTRLDGAAAFVAMWQRLPGWRWLARLARLPGGLPLLEAAYSGFLRVRPSLQTLARRWESKVRPAP